MRGRFVFGVLECLCSSSSLFGAHLLRTGVFVFECLCLSSSLFGALALVTTFAVVSPCAHCSRGSRFVVLMRRLSFDEVHGSCGAW
mgnify:FL=1